MAILQRSLASRLLFFTTLPLARVHLPKTTARQGFPQQQAQTRRHYSDTPTWRQVLSPVPTTAGKTIKLRDGRNLGYHEYGDANGTPVIYIHGTPDSGVTLSGFENHLAKRLGVRWVAPDRPGIGLSTFHQDRRVIDYPSDLQHLIDHLGLDQYRILGTSGGTGYVLACAQQLPKHQLLAVGICAGVGPWEAGLDGQSPLMQKVMKTWQKYPDSMASLLEDRYVAAARHPDPAEMERRWREDLNCMGGFEEADREFLTKADAFQSAVKVFRQVWSQGVSGHADEMRLVTCPWGFDLEEVAYEGICLWYGSNDKNTSPEMGRCLAKRLSHAVYKEYPGESHYSIWREELVQEFLQDLLRIGSV